MESEFKRIMMWFLLIIIIIGVNGARQCPSTCECSLDVRGLRQVKCSVGGMKEIPSTTFDDNTEIIIINAPEGRHNDLTIGPIFRHLERLEELTISKSRVPAIGSHSFWGLKHLRMLDLSHNEIRQIVDEHFRGLIILRTLHLDDNFVDSMPSNAFMYMEELNTLTLSKNRIKELVPRVFLKLGKLRVLDISYNPLMDLNPEVFKDIQELREFKCRACGLSNLNTLLYRIVANLQILDLSENQFKFLRTDEFVDLKNLRELYLDGNQMSVILDKTFGASTPKLEILSMAHNRIAKVTNNAFLNGTSLMKIDIGYNKLDHLDAPVFQTVSEPLRSLTLSGNNIPPGDLKTSLHSVFKLQELNLADMGLVTLPIGIFVFHEYITTLNLSSNAFVHFPAQLLAPLTRLEILDLSENKFRGLDARLLTRLEKSDVTPGSEAAEVMPVKIPGTGGGVMVKLAGNPWACDKCHVGPLLEWISKFTSKNENCEEDSVSLLCLKCASPRSMHGKLLSSIEPSSLEWCVSGGSIAGYGSGDEETESSFFPHLGLLAASTAAAIAVLLLLTAIAVAAINYGRHAAHYYTHEEERVTGNESIYENPAVSVDEHGDLRFSYADAQLTSKGGKKMKKIKFVSIATIDEITKDPELQQQQTNLSNGAS